LLLLGHGRTFLDEALGKLLVFTVDAVILVPAFEGVGPRARVHAKGEETARGRGCRATEGLYLSEVCHPPGFVGGEYATLAAVRDIYQLVQE